MATAQTTSKGAVSRLLRQSGRRLLPVIVLPLLIAPQSTAPGAVPSPNTAASAATKPGLTAAGNLGAADLFAALTEPDRVAEIDALRAIRRELTSADDPRARDAARDQLDSLLEIEERRQPDVPPALVLSSLAARIDNAIAGLEQLAQAQSTPLEIPRSLATFMGPTALLAAFGAVAGALSVGTVAQRLLRRKLTKILDLTLVDFKASLLELQNSLQSSGRLLDQAHTTVVSAVDDALSSVKGTNAATARLTSAGVEVEMRLRDCMDVIDTRQRRSAELAAECETVTQNLPVVLASAIEAMSARGLQNVDAAIRELSAGVNNIIAAHALLPPIVAELQSHASGFSKDGASRDQRMTVALDRIEALAQALPDVAARLAECPASFHLNQPVNSPVPGAHTTVTPQDGRAASLDAAIDRAHDFVALLPQVTASLAEAAAQLRRDSSAVGTMHVDADATAIIGAMAEAAALLQREAACFAASSPERTGIVTTLTNAVAELRDEASTLAKQERTHLAELSALISENATALALLPSETKKLVAASAATPDAVLALTSAASKLAAESHQLCVNANTHANASMALVRLSVELPSVTCELTDLAKRTFADIANATAGLHDTAASLNRNTGAQATILADVACRADAVLAALPVELNQLTAASAWLQHCSATLEHATRCLGVNTIELAEAGTCATKAITDHADLMAEHLRDAVCALDRSAMAVCRGATVAQDQALDGARAAEMTLKYLTTQARELAGQTHGEATSKVAADIMNSVDRLWVVLAALENAAERQPLCNHFIAANQQTKLAPLELSVTSVMDATSQLGEHTETQANSASAVAYSAADLANMTAAVRPTPTMAWLGGFSSQSRLLLRAASNMAEAAIKGDVSSLPTDVIDEMPSILDIIESSIEGLRGTATAVAIASDSARAAASRGSLVMPRPAVEQFVGAHPAV